MMNNVFVGWFQIIIWRHWYGHLLVMFSSLSIRHLKHFSKVYTYILVFLLQDTCTWDYIKNMYMLILWLGGSRSNAGISRYLCKL